jgi:hypothetical protein
VEQSPQVDDSRQFRISIVPANEGVTVLLGSDALPNLTLGMMAWEYQDVSFGQFTGNTFRGSGLVYRKIDNVASLSDYAMNLYKPPAGTLNPYHDSATVVMLKGISEPQFAILREDVHSSKVHGADPHQDLGSGMYWYISPPLPDEVVENMPTFDGFPCGTSRSDCPDVGFWVSGAAGFMAILPTSTLTLLMVLVLSVVPLCSN